MVIDWAPRGIHLKRTDVQTEAESTGAKKKSRLRTSVRTEHYILCKYIEY